MVLRIKRTQPRSLHSIRSRASQCREIWDAAKSKDTKTVTIEADSVNELNSTYKSMIQWRKRHREDMPCTVSKDGSRIFVTAGSYNHPRDDENAHGNEAPKTDHAHGGPHSAYAPG